MRASKLLLPLILIALAVVWWQYSAAPSQDASAANRVASTSVAQTSPQPDLPPFLPAQAPHTLQAIARGGPFQHSQDGVVFGNYEGLLPREPRGYYHEYTVETPGARIRGARRIVTGGSPPTVYYYTDDHYRSFRRFEWNP